jgi:hypothetical protein
LEAQMRFSWLLLLILIAGCVHAPTDRASVNVERQAPFGIVRLDDFFSYVIDPRTESCFISTPHFLVAVPCAPLKRNLPEAAKYITWDSGK